MQMAVGGPEELGSQVGSDARQTQAATSPTTARQDGLRLTLTWIVVPRNLLFLKLSCAKSQREMPLQQVSLELGLTILRRIDG